MSEDRLTILNHVKGAITIDFDSRREVDIIYNAIYLELKTASDYRSKVDIEIEDRMMTIFIKSQDMTSFRASMNSIIKWIKLSYEMIKTIDC
ncbi:MAG: hypothetical protein LBC39_08505 [Methanobrevibacter sp.]|jgi:KEOPS complex subunit Pcc1|nr:hypothetical protein [Candidatus Methanovirga aequatorialis]